MTRLVVKKFSCIDDADIELSNVTVLIGPQASGKSVLSKLVYFFFELADRQFYLVQEGLTFEDFSERMEEDFAKWFPPGAWGEQKFLIEFYSGDYGISVQPRPRSSKRKGDRKVKFAFSETLQDVYKSAVSTLQRRESRESPKDIQNNALFSNRRWEFLYQVRRAGFRKIQDMSGGSFPEDLLFIPAGRSFFTSLGRAIQAFEHGNMLDPATLDFGRYFTTAREIISEGYYPYRGTRAREATVSKEFMEEVFGGELKIDRNDAYVVTRDKRRIPFAYLSSGQQELLPLLIVLQNHQQTDRVSLTFIEEPEAHLFPDAQSKITKLLARLVTSRGQRRSLFVTTHSPYVLAVLNNLMMAGKIGPKTDPVARKKLAAFLPEALWLKEGFVSAYAIHDGKTHLLISEGLIDASYLDRVSADIAEEFTRIIEIGGGYEN